MDREKRVIKTSIIGIIANVFLAGFKAVVGLLSNSIAIVMDAVNNLSDALSSIITIVGTKIAGKAPDKKHPLGHGRVEYLTTMVISIIILYAGITSLIESIKKIINPVTPDYKTVSLIIIAVAVVVKIVLGTYVKKVGLDVNSDSLVASGKDALFDSVISASTLIAAIIFIFTKVSLEAYLGVIISIIIIKSGVDMLRDTISDILGRRVESEVAQNVKGIIRDFDEVSGVYDLIFHSYGPERLVGSAHIEVREDMTVRELDKLERQITEKVLCDTGIAMTGISVYSRSDGEGHEKELESEIKKMVLAYKDVIEVHGYYKEDDNIRFDIIIDFDCKERKKIYGDVLTELSARYPEYNFAVTLDADITD